MTPLLLEYICEPITKDPLELVEAVFDPDGSIRSGKLVSPRGRVYPIIRGIPRFMENVPTQTVTSFGDEWNYFNFTDFKTNWLEHTVANTFGGTEVFKDKLIVDAGGGSGAQSKWMSEYGAKHVILMELSHSVDGVVQRNLVGLKNVDVIQCSIDAPPLRDASIDGIVYCHNVIQHTPSVRKTAHALFHLVAPGGEFVFNCYGINDQGLLRWIRYHVVYKALRAALSRMPYVIIMSYARLMAAMRLMPGIGWFMEKSGFCIQGDVPHIDGETGMVRLRRRFRATCLNTFDAFGSHQYQHFLSESDQRTLLSELQPDASKVENVDKTFTRPCPVACAFRIRP